MILFTQALQNIEVIFTSYFWYQGRLMQKLRNHCWICRFQPYGHHRSLYFWDSRWREYVYTTSTVFNPKFKNEELTDSTFMALQHSSQSLLTSGFWLFFDSSLQALLIFGKHWWLCSCSPSSSVLPTWLTEICSVGKPDRTMTMVCSHSIKYP